MGPQTMGDQQYLTIRVENGSDLSKLLDEAIPLAPGSRAELLYNSSALESAHQAAANKGDTVAPNPTEDVDLHYVCFVKAPKSNHLWELDGRRKGPLDRGLLKEGDDVLSESALDLGVRAFLRREQDVAKNAAKDGSAGGSGGSGGSGSGGEMRFSLVVLAPSLE